MSGEQFLDAYHDASTPPSPDVPPELSSFMLAADPVLAQAAELARVITRAHQGAATQLIGEGWPHARKYFSLSEKYAAWADYRTPAKGVGIHAYAHKVDRPLRLTDSELRAHPEWRNFSDEVDDHPPMRGWLAVPLIGSDGVNYGSIQASDRLDGEFTEQDEANLVRLATLTATALDALAQVHLPEYRKKVAERVPETPRMTDTEDRGQEPSSSSEGYATVFGEWKVWFEWGSARFDAPGEGIPPAWFARRGTYPTVSIPAIGLTEEEFRRRLGGFFDESTVGAVERDFEPRIANTDLGPVLAPRPSR
ncbi:MAG: domain S-box [Actinomycetia bacterium]|nr:domain S-box [Actinomycetes bacterium]